MRSERPLSIVVPVRNERAAVAGTLACLREPEVLEVIVVDGHSEDGTAGAASPLADRVLECEPGRARQMNAGARAAHGEFLLFLHADTVMPAGFARAILEAFRRGAVGGRFDLELDAEGLAYRALELAINLRSRWTRLYTGDQAIFVRRDVFESLGGFPDVPLFEDLEMARRLRRVGSVACLRERVRTSARRWRQRGVVRTVLVMWALRSLWGLGVSPLRLARFYRDVR